MEPRRTVAALFIACFALLGSTQAVSLEVKEGNTTCIRAELSASFSITYNTSSGTSMVDVSLPDSAAVDPAESSCGTNGSPSWLVAVFGSGHALQLTFASNGSVYSMANLSLQYNLSDSSLFPGSNSSDVVTVVSSSLGIWATLNTTYRCNSPVSFNVGGVTVTFRDMRLEAYMPGNDLSDTESICTADQAMTTAPPTTNSTTTTATTTAATTTAPAPTPPGTPDRGRYSVLNGTGTECLLAHMGLQLNVSYFSRPQNKTIQSLVNLNPKLVNSSGSCEATTALLTLTQEQSVVINFTFTLNASTSRYHLSAISLFANWPDMTRPLLTGNASLNYLQSTLGHSYMCNAERVLAVAPDFSLNTFSLQVQPFDVTSNQFGTAEECQVDRDQMLIPIIVGATLAGLVLIVLIAYLIGRKKSHAGYQTI
ncbi:lysosome-associated membrane glycoprotein 1a [Nelusetta ayraudi]|uniref:lysosome-associated membrane glycoprotein 1a n=1 Tax=Nelusetta ayraudi TaxID=303726 RepID=UPI003F7146A8